MDIQAYKRYGLPSFLFILTILPMIGYGQNLVSLKAHIDYLAYYFLFDILDIYSDYSSSFIRSNYCVFLVLKKRYISVT